MYKKIALLLLLMVLILPVFALDIGLSSTSKTSVDMKAGEVKFSDRDSSLSVSTTTLINNVQFVPAYEAKEGEKVIWGTDEKYLIIFPDPVVKFTYENTDEKTLKETIILKEDKELAFVVNLDKNTRIIPWENGQWKIVSAVDTSDTMTGIVALQPYGIDANGNRIEMEYKWVKETNTLNLTYNREVLVLNEKLTNEGKPNEAGIRDPIYDKLPISYPLTIDPTWVKVDAYYRSYYETETIVMFNATGATTWTAPSGVSSVWFTIVAGGGGGGGYYSGGGGAGGFLNGTTTNITPGSSYYISVGAGGAGGSSGSSYFGYSGGNSVFSNITTTGGGGGADAAGTATYTGANGGSGGGGTYTGIGGTGVSGQGYRGGDGYTDPYYHGGGGGGASAAGVNATSTYGGNGGNGLQSNISTCLTYYSGGGGGWGAINGTGGLGGGGNANVGPGSNAVSSTGSGGGAGGSTGTTGGAGANGIIYLRYNTTQTFDKWEKNDTGHWIMLNGSMVYHMFNETGNYSWNVNANTANANYIIVAGGGSGGGTASAGGGGGGGAGGFISGIDYPINGTINISVGAGGVGAPTSTFNGSPSNLSMIQALGGGGGAISGVGNPGGSGGGSSVSLSYGGDGITGQGMMGGASTTSLKYGGGGGGGNLSLGMNGTTTSGGWSGRCNTTYLGIYMYNLSAGGGGGIYDGGTAGADYYCLVGGAGNVGNAAGGSAVQKTGSGGGGSGGKTLSYKGGDGGSGVVFIWHSNVSTAAPIALFSQSNVSGPTPLYVNFTDTSTNTPTAWNWTFGVANFSNAQNPNYIFIGEGNYSVVLNVSNSVGFNVSPAKYVNTTPPAPLANFTSDITSDYVPFTVQFNDTSTNLPTGWTWFFGDEPYTQGWTRLNASAGWAARSVTGSVVMPDGSIVLMGGLNNTVRLNDTWRSTNNGSTWTQVNASSGWSARSTILSLVLQDGSILLMGGFDGTNYYNDTWRSNDKGVTWSLVNSSSGWSKRSGLSGVVMGDNSIVIMGGYSGSANLNDTWKSTDSGRTWTRMNASSGWGTRMYSSSSRLSNDDIVIVGGIQLSGTVRYNDAWKSSDYGATWTRVNSSVFPGGAGKYGSASVVMPDNSIVLLGGANVTYRNDIIRSTNAGSTWTLINGSAGWAARSLSTSVVLPNGSIIIMAGEGAAIYQDVWMFNPRGSALQNATHTYSVPGNYNVSLTAYNQYGWNTSLKISYIAALSLIPDFTSNSTVGTMYPYVVQFNDTSSGAATTWNWSFGDGRWFNTTSSALRNTTYTYAVAGKYDVSLKINNTIITNTTTKTQYINLTSDNDNNLTSWMHMNGTNGSTTFTDEKGLAWTVNGNSKITNISYKYGNGSGYFDGTGDYISTPNSSAIAFGTSDFTIEFWMNVSAIAGTNEHVFSKTTNTRSRGWGMDRTDSAKGDSGWDFWMGNDSAGQVFFNTPIQNKTWVHITIERQSGSIYLYVNGNLSNSSAGFGGNYDTTDPLRIGRQGTNYYTGFVDEFRISRGLARWNANFTPPYNEYRGTLETIYPDINPNSTMRFKTNPGGNASISNTTPRNRTIQIENVYNTSYVIGVATFDPLYFYCKAVRLNETYFPTGMTLISSNIDNTLGEVSFNISRPAGFNGGTDRASIVDYEIVYYNYSQPNTPLQQFFGSGHLLNGSTYQLYPIHNFISTNVTLLEWTITTNFTANDTILLTGDPVLFTDDSYLYDSYPTQWNWSFGDGTWDNGTNQTPTHAYTTPGLKSVSLQAGLWQNQSIYTILTKTDYIDVYDYVQASFTSNTTSGLGVIPVQFNDTTLNITSAWNWSFNNITGNNTEVWFSTTQNATHVFGIGNWSIRLNASNLLDYNITPANTYFINVSTINPVVEFTANSTIIVQGTPVEFTDLSQAFILSWSWNFGDGNTSILQNPTHTYDLVGTHSVSLNVVNFSGSNSTTKINYIVVNPRIYPVADFTYNGSGGIQNIPVQFTSTSISNILTYEWTFGDGNSSLSANPLHVYSVPGTYSVKLNVSNASGYGETTKLNIITITERVPPVPDFTGTPLVGQAPLSVAFTDSSITGITAWSWTFGDGGTSTLQNPTHVYNTIGSFDVSLTVQNASDVNTTTKLLYINTTNEHIYANFVVSPTSATTIPATITFTDTSTSTPGTVIDTWLWNFGDGSTSSLQNPTHIYTIAGLYTISLTASGSTLVPISDTKTNNNFLPISNNTPYVYPVQAAIDLPNYTSHGINYNFLYYLLVSNRTGPWEFPVISMANTLMAPFTEAFETIGGEGWGSGVYFILLGTFFILVWRNSGSVRIPTLMAVIVSGGWAILLPESAYPWVLIIITACLASMLLQLFAQEGT